MEDKLFIGSKLEYKGRYEDAIDLLNKIGDEPENSIFYLNRGLIFEMNGINPMKDFEKGMRLIIKTGEYQNHYQILISSH